MQSFFVIKFVNTLETIVEKEPRGKNTRPEKHVDEATNFNRKIH